MANKKAVPKPKKDTLIEAKPSGPFHFKGSNFHVLFIGVVVVLCFALYGNSIPNGYSLDDEFVLHGDTTVQKGIAGIPKLFGMRYAWDQKGAYGYRPVVKASFALEDQFFGVSPHPGHIINIIIYALLIVFLFYFLRKILFDKVSDYFLFFVVAIFLSHPLHTEVVDSLKNRDAMLAFIFGLFCTYAFVKAFENSGMTKRIVWIVIGCASFDLGCLSKFDTRLFLGITPLVLYFFSDKKVRNSLLSILFIIIGFFVSLIVKRHILPKTEYHRTFVFYENPLLNSHWYQRFQLGFASLWFYIHKLILPKDLISYYGYDEFHPFPKWSDGNVLAGIVIAGFIVWAGYKLIMLFKEEKSGMDVWLFAFLLFMGTLIVYINVVKVGPGIVAERMMFIPSVGFALLASLLLFKAFKASLTASIHWSKYSSMYLVSLVLIVLFSGRTIARNPNWMSHLSIYEHDAKVAPRSAKLQSLLGSSYMDEVKRNKNLTTDEIAVMYEKAEKAFLAAVDVYPQYSTALNNIGMIEYMYYKKPDIALGYFSKAVEGDSNYTIALFNMACSYREMKNYPKAEEYFLKSIYKDPKYDLAYTYLSKLYSLEGKYNEVIKLNENALKDGHRSDAIYINIGKVYLDNQDTSLAITYFDTALTYFSKNGPLCQWLTNYYLRKKDTVKAKHYADMKNGADQFAQDAAKRLD